MSYAIGLDYGTNSVRCVVVDTRNGKELGTAVFNYPTGKMGIILDRADHNLARQDPADYLQGLQVAVMEALAQAKKAYKGFSADQVVGIGVDTTGSTPIPVDENGQPLALHRRFKGNPNACAWLWKDHTGYAEAARITELAAQEHPEYLAKCGGVYSSEWFFSKIWHCRNADKKVFDAAHTWVEHADWIPAVLTGTDHPSRLKRCRCAAGHKAMFSDQWGGYPERDFLAKLHPDLGRVRDTLPSQTYTIDQKAGSLTSEWAKRLGLPGGIPVAIGAFDAHLGAVGAGVAKGTLVKIIGTSTCDMTVWPNTQKVADVPGICGIVDGSILPGYWGLEAGQSAVGDIFNWFVNEIEPAGPKLGSHEVLTKAAAKLRPGQSGLLALDWNNGNRTILVDQRLTGLLIGQTLLTHPAEIYRALIEATAFGALTIINRFEEYGVKVRQVVNCGGIAEKNPLLMQIYADVTGRQMKVSRSAQTCALGAAMAGAVVGGAHKTFASAQLSMCGLKKTVYKPDRENHRTYQQLYRLYKQLHDGFGVKDHQASFYNVMKDLLAIKERVSRA